ncbi:ABC transporter ATP-binding protein [Dyadobacter beijingensis]|uniref:ABC transporter ATP-binding protein n=1 Tax=Dyadobacter beijingensis TaxID=365489 RepID=A0ABQ2IFQ1_9BACT|nr:ATP-binding cassette domain-containing protein [Dyadobacter beijingensis]GGN07810.1 ABC transporter ATP-binding protein [Dyadobacter beijingensis]
MDVATHHTLEADSIWLAYQEQKILQNIYIKLETGHITGLLGRNGTGKSCLMRMIFGTLRGESQSVRVNGDYISHPYLQAGLISYLPQHNFLPKQLRVKEVCQLYHVDFEAVCEHFEALQQYRNTRIGDLSTGNVRLIGTLLVVLLPVSFTLLDEPFAALSPLAVEQMRKVILGQKPHKGILISDHSYEDVVAMADETYLLVPVGRSIRLKNVHSELAEFGYI